MPAPPANGTRLYSPPYPNLQTYPQSGAMAGIPWAEVASFDMSAGEDGVSLGMSIMVYWQDLSAALAQILGFSFFAGSQFSRQLPWQNPKYNQFWAHSIARVEGRRIEGLSTAVGDFGNIKSASPGAGGAPNVGPASEYNLAIITIKFWRPPYAVRTDEDVFNASTGKYQEWLRYTDRQWTIESQYITSESTQLNWSGADGSGGYAGGNWNSGLGAIPAPLGNTVSHAKLSRRWYQIPEQGIFATNAQDSTPTGFMTNLFYTQTQTTNPITGFVYKVGNPIPGCVNSPIGGNPWNGNAQIVGNLDGVPANQLFGMPMGTLRFENAEIVSRPLQLPPYLMDIPSIANNEALSQVQYDIVFHFDYFDPPRGVNAGGTQQPFHGHNLGPYSGDLLWYPIRSQKTATGNYVTPYHYADLSDLFTLL